MIRIAIQAKGRLNEQSMELLCDAGIQVDDNKRKFLTKANNYPVEVLYLRDDDIPQAVQMGVADVGIVGYNEVMEKGFDVEIADWLGFGGCRISLAIPQHEQYESVRYFNGKRIATSYPRILRQYFEEQGVKADIHVIAGSVEIAPAVGMGDAIFDIVSSGSTLVRNGLKEVQTVLKSEAVLIANKQLDAEKLEAIAQLKFRFEAIKRSKGMKYVLMNVPDDKVTEVIQQLPSMRSPTVLPLAQNGWSSIHTVVNEDVLWSVVEKLKKAGAEDILILALEKMIP